MAKNLITSAVLIDLSKAFDTVDCARLLSKLSNYGIKDREMCYSVRNKLTINGRSSEMQPISCGVPQGSILGPLMFILLINDMEPNLNYVIQFSMLITLFCFTRKEKY